MIFLIFLTALLFSAFFSASEMAFVTTGAKKWQLPGKKRILSFFWERPERVLITGLVGTNLANVAAAISMTYFLLQIGRKPEEAVGLAGVIVTLSILFFGEIIPKGMVRADPLLFLSRFRLPLWISYLIFYPFVLTLEFLIGRIRKKREFSKEEFETIIIRAVEEGRISEKEGRLLREALYLLEKKTEEFVTPREEIPLMPVGASIEEIFSRIRSLAHCKLLIFGETLDEIKGAIKAVDLLKVENKEEVAKLIRSLPFVFKEWPLGRTLREMREKGATTAIVLDEYGGTQGILTVDNLIDNFLQHILWEKEKGEEITVEGDTKLGELTELGFEFEEPSSSTIAGIIIENLGYIPKKGEKVRIGTVLIEIVDSDGKKIKKLRIKKEEEIEEENKRKDKEI